MLRILGASCVFVIAAAFALGEQDAEPSKLAVDKDQLKDWLEKARAKHDLPAMAAVVVNDKGMQIGAVVGVRKRGEKVKATLDDQFHLGSATKPMTAWLIAWLVERGLLAWDTPLGKYFPELAKDWPEDARKITLVHLLTHHSGLPANFPGGWWALPTKGVPRDMRLAMMKKLGGIKLESQPGEKYLYSNFGYTVAGAVAERAAKDTWENLLKKHLFDPLKIKSAGHGPMGKEGAIVQPWQHQADGTPIAPKLTADNPPVMGPAGRVHCSLPDWSKFVAESLRGMRGDKGLLKPASYEKLYDTPFKDTFCVVGGWIGQRKEEGKPLALGHDGSNTQNYVAALLLPGDNIAVIVATNQGGDPGKKACHEVRDNLIEALRKK